MPAVLGPCPSCQYPIPVTHPLGYCSKCGKPLPPEMTTKLPLPKPTTPPTRVTVVDVDMPIGSMVTLMLKWAFASIPAAVVIVVVVGMATAAVTAVLATLGLLLR